MSTLRYALARTELTEPNERSSILKVSGQAIRYRPLPPPPYLSHQFRFIGRLSKVGRRGWRLRKKMRIWVP